MDYWSDEDSYAEQYSYSVYVSAFTTDASIVVENILHIAAKMLKQFQWLFLLFKDCH